MATPSGDSIKLGTALEIRNIQKDQNNNPIPPSIALATGIDYLNKILIVHELLHDSDNESKSFQKKPIARAISHAELLQGKVLILSDTDKRALELCNSLLCGKIFFFFMFKNYDNYIMYYR